MRISVVTVCRNSESTIGKTLSSVATQDWHDIEHIVIDGASTDKTVQIIRASPHVAKFVSERDSGIYDAMNKGIAMATGDIIALLNADDHYAADGVLTRIVAEFEGDPACDAVFTDIQFFKNGDPGMITRRYASARFRPELLRWGWMPAHPGMFVKKIVYEQVGLYRTDYKIAADFEFVARAFWRRAFIFKSLPIVSVLMSAGGVSTRGFASNWLINREVVRACRENGINTNLAMILTKYPLKLMEIFRR